MLEQFVQAKEESSVGVEEIEVVVNEIVAEMGGKVERKEMGKLIKLAVERLKGQAGGKEVSDIVKKALQDSQ